LTEKLRARLVGRRVLVFDPEDARRLYSLGFYGRSLGNPKPRSPDDVRPPLELSLVEALYLVEKGVLEVVDPEGRRVEASELARLGRSVNPEFDKLYRVYRELRDAGYVVRSGLKYGADYAVYEQGPGIDHAPYVVHVLGYRETIDPLEIVRAGRLSHSVRKRFIVAAVDDETGATTYIMFKWCNP
jgi:tRNA-intron endonuclease